MSQTEVTREEAGFVNGEPNAPFTKMYKCFKNQGNGLLFRLVDEASKQWAFYNDTADTTIKVTTRFQRDNDFAVGATGAAREVVNSNGETQLEVTVSVPPRDTVIFLTGDVKGAFEMDFQTEAAPANDVAFENGEPDVKYTNKFKCFKENGNGLLFRLVDEEKKKWYFYNDTTQYKMVAQADFNDKTAVSRLGNTTEVGAPEGNPNGVTYRLEIDPGKTEPFISGEPFNFKLAFSADLLSNDHPIEPEYENSQPDNTLVSPKAKVYKCFKKNGNGLLFRLVDEENQLWAFYNDTAEYLMRATVRFSAGQNYKPSDDAQAYEDSEEPGGTILIMDIPPLTTRVFLYGLPTDFEVSFAAESANKAVPEKNPQYALNGPDDSVLNIDEVYKCFKDKEAGRDGILFRLVDTQNHRWAFYNDTTDIDLVVRVKFEDGAQKPLGNAVHDNDPEWGMTILLEIAPGTTELFAEGDLGSFKSKFIAQKRAAAQ
ncbi:hypothetical protein AGDE_10008 [Angomonas deanei]|uniref:DUF1935 domain-containing protein n=1 Tax=Angomonas deanei TaxID=59799 RepID=A0A7G2CFN0_9TRYP|nr:hypothetical protein AGDE_10008 [Angomonas deanei]CAD2216962.1 Domain of unknown function (DUF1935), putative [Angomonas deanei]|eukprot:EPY29333.1 hypothetical protein AGDE_10008 [Angomonas deanei]